MYRRLTNMQNPIPPKYTDASFFVGDASLKSVVISEPEIMEVERTADDICVVLACDGLWDALQYETCTMLIKQILSMGDRSGKIVTFQTSRISRNSSSTRSSAKY